MAEMPFTVRAQKNKDKARARESCFLCLTELKMPDHRKGPQAVLEQMVVRSMVRHKSVVPRSTLLYLTIYNLC